MRNWFLIFFMVFAAGCRDRHQSIEVLYSGSYQEIAILPFVDIDSSIAIEIKNELAKQFSDNITILPHTPLPLMAYYKPRERYLADSLLNYLRLVNNRRYAKVIGITDADISTRKMPYQNWGVMGLGECPGEACIISSFRVKKSATGHRHFIARMTLLAMHELGHTYSLPHCSADSCIMKDAEGKMSLDDAKTYCDNCSKTLT